MEKNSTITAIIANCLKGMFPAPLGTFGFRIITILFVLLSFLPFAPITDSLETIQQLEISRKYATLTPVIFAIYSLVTIVVFALFVIRILSDINGYGVYEKDQIFTSGTLISVYLFFFLQIAPDKSVSQSQKSAKLHYNTSRFSASANASSSLNFELVP